MKNVLIIERKYKLEMCQARWERDRYRKKERKKERDIQNEKERYRMKERDNCDEERVRLKVDWKIELDRWTSV